MLCLVRAREPRRPRPCCYALGLLSSPRRAALLLPALPAGGNTAELRARLARGAPAGACPVVLALVIVLAQSPRPGHDRRFGHAGAGYLRAAWHALGMHLSLLLGLMEPTVKYVPLPGRRSRRVDLLPLAAAGRGAEPTLARRSTAQSCQASAYLGRAQLPARFECSRSRATSPTATYLPLVCAIYAGALDGLCRSCRGRAAARRAAGHRAARVLAGHAALRRAFTTTVRCKAQALRRYPHNPRVPAMGQWCGQSRGVRPKLTRDRCLPPALGDVVRRTRGMLLGRLGRFDEARSWLERARQRHPDDVSVRSALATSANHRRAVRAATLRAVIRATAPAALHGGAAASAFALIRFFHRPPAVNARNDHGAQRRAAAPATTTSPASAPGTPRSRDQHRRRQLRRAVVDVPLQRVP